MDETELKYAIAPLFDLLSKGIQGNSGEVLTDDELQRKRPRANVWPRIKGITNEAMQEIGEKVTMMNQEILGAKPGAKPGANAIDLPDDVGMFSSTTL